MRCFSGLSKYLEKTRNKPSISDVAIGRRFLAEPDPSPSLEGEDPTSIVEEFRISYNLKDIIDELRILEHMFITQQTVIRNYSETKPSESLGPWKKFLENWPVEAHITRTRTLATEAKKILADVRAEP